jgi:hypothetical protein
MTAREILRLRDVDTALASREGLHVGTLAAKHSCDRKTIRRDQYLLARIVGPIVSERVPADNYRGYSYVSRYIDRKRRLFAKETP